MNKERFKCVTAVHIFLIKDNHILLLRRYDTGYEDGNYSVLAGHLEGNESVLEAAQRESLEEGGVNIPFDSLNFVGVMHRKSNDERIDFFFEATEWLGNVVNMEPNKCDELRWFPLDALPLNVIPYVKRAIDNYKENIYFDTQGF
ncbi:NUDIX hydrolase [Staphylococcus caeli]|uniref:NUDIX hydrolase n=1 Tax=Staphylococcus caeli TaxID=2201815 RepID=UPI003F56AE8F